LKTYAATENPDIYRLKLQMNGFQYQYSKNCWHRNNGDGISFSDVRPVKREFRQPMGWSPLFADFDNDGKKDLFISTGIVKRRLIWIIKFASALKNKGMDRTINMMMKPSMPCQMRHGIRSCSEMENRFDAGTRWEPVI
jgi:hypothetical protein